MAKINWTPIIVAGVIVVGILIVLGVLLTRVPAYGKTVSATGVYEMSVMPDEAVVYLNIQTRNESAQVAKDKNSKITDDVITALVKLGLDREDIETENFNIYQEYDWEDGKRIERGFVATNTVKVTTTDFEIVGKIVDESVDAGALVNYINFELSNDKSNDYKAQALSGASADAKKKAEAVASGLGKSLGALVSVSSSDYNYQPYPLYRTDMAVAAEGAAVKAEVQSLDLTPKKLDISATVSVTYKIR
ncbi:SIMPL domain-containing protein [Candidatus Woesearchaeota archaeon]|nr:SIMPL domain-containing protein [Candidatus Woesearchaeota archaeon]